MQRKLWVLASALMFTAALAVHADEASKAAKVEEFFRVSHTEDMLHQTMQMVMDQTKSGALQQMMGNKPTAQESKSMADFTDKMGVILTNALSWEKLKPIFVKVYMETFTEPELEGIIAFYKSPSGQAFVSKTPSLMAQSNQLVQQQMASAMADVQKLMKEYAAQNPKK